MKKYVDRDGIMKQLNKRSVLFFKRTVSARLSAGGLPLFSANADRNEGVHEEQRSTIQTLLRFEQFYYSPVVLLPRGKLFHKIVFTQARFEVAGLRFIKLRCRGPPKENSRSLQTEISD